MNRCKIDLVFYRQLIKGLTTHPKNKKVRDFIIKWTPAVKHGKLYYGSKEIIPYEHTERILKKEAEGSMPLSRDGAFKFLAGRYIGFKKKRIGEWLKRVEQLQMIKTRPHKNSRQNDLTREGTKNYFMRAGDLGKYSLGVDLFDLPKEFTKHKFLYVAVLQRSGYCWCYPINNKTASLCLAKLKLVFKDCKKIFGHEPTGIASDFGNEFQGKHTEWIQQKKIRHKILTDRGTMCWWVEKKNSQMARSLAVMLKSGHGFKEALRLTLEKVNNTVSRVTRKAPVDFYDFQSGAKRYNRKLKKNPTRRKQPVYKVGNRVRYALKGMGDKAAFYKSYQGMRNRQTAMWSKTIFPIKATKKLAGLMYLVNKIYRYPWELQLITGELVTLSHSKPKPLKKKAVPRRQLSQQAPIVLYQNQPVRRSGRLRRKARVHYPE